MKIISKYKDYYDHIQGIYGIDEKKVLERNNICTEDIIDDVILLVYCNRIYLRCNNLTANNLIRARLSDLVRFELIDHSYFYHFEEKKLFHIDSKYSWWDVTADVIQDTITKGIDLKIRSLPYYCIHPNLSTFVPLLVNTGFNRIKSAEECFLDIQEFISYKEPEIKNSPTNMNRFESKGFDKKLSFRGKNK